MDTPWRIEFLGRLRATRGERVVTRFRARKTGGLFAFLAYHLDRPHPRELLIELLWPEAEPHAGRSSLSRELTSLRRQLEPPGLPAGAVIIADRDCVQLNPAACTTDVQAFEAALQRAARARGGVDRIACLTDAAELYQGELLPGYFEEWILPERQRLAERYLHALEQLATSLEQAGDPHGGIQWARRAVAADPLWEDGHHTLIRLFHAIGQPGAAVRQYQELERLLAQGPGMAPTPEIRALVREIERGRSTAYPACSPVTPVPTPAPAARNECWPAAPTGTVTFLLVEIQEQAARESWDDGLRPLFSAHNGHELRADSGMHQVAFARASDALAAAVSVHCHCASRMPQLPSFPRLALHTAEVPSDKLTQHSPALQHVTRLLRAAHPGQILLSDKSAFLLRDDLSPGIDLLDLGQYRLHDAARPEHLFQVCPPDLPAGPFPPPNALPAHEGSLPLQFTRFFGREAEITRLRELLGETADGGRQTAEGMGECPSSPNYRLPTTVSRLITLTGPGGSGKTRLAVEAAHQLRWAYHGAVWFVPLQDLREACRIPAKLLDVLRVPHSPQMEPMDQAVAFLSRQPSLLLLDNLEHLVTEGGVLVQTLLEQVPSLTCLVTSRQWLNLPGEREFPVAPLPVPADGFGLIVGGLAAAGASEPSAIDRQLSALTQCPSVQLFIDRAQAVLPDFQVTASNAVSVARLCARLEGLPLALVLAAARVGVMTPQEMLARIEQRLDFLATRQRGTPSRHLSLRAALDWSYQLLSPELQRFFTRLSVFRGGWTVAAAEAVCAEPRTLEYLEQLRECSFVQAVESGGEMRFCLLETLREYGAEQLSDRERGELGRCHARYYLALAEEADRGLCSPELEPWLARLKAEHDNMRAALAGALALQEVETALRLGGALAGFWWTESHLSEGRTWLEASLALPGADARTAARALALRGLGLMAWMQADYEAARATLHESIAIGRELGDKVGPACALGHLGWVEHESGPHLATMRAAREESLALYREAGDLWGTAWASHCLGRTCAAEGDHETAWWLHKEAERLFRAQGHAFHLAYPLIGLGHVALSRGDYPAARDCFSECLAIRSRYGSQSSAMGNVVACLALTEWCLGDWQAAIGHFEQCVDLRRAAGMTKSLARSLLEFGSVAVCAGRLEPAAAALRESLDLCRKHGDQSGEAQAQLALARLARAQEQPAEAATLLRGSLALAPALADPATVAAGIEETAALLSGRGAPDGWRQAARLLGATAALRTPGGEVRPVAPLRPPEQARRDEQCAAACAVLGNTAFQIAWEAGRSLTLEQAAAEAMQALAAEARFRSASTEQTPPMPGRERA